MASEWLRKMAAEQAAKNGRKLGVNTSASAENGEGSTKLPDPERAETKPKASPWLQKMAAEQAAKRKTVEERTDQRTDQMDTRMLLEQAKVNYQRYAASDEHRNALRSYTETHKWDGLKNALTNPLGGQTSTAMAVVDPEERRLKAIVNYYEQMVQQEEDNAIMEADMAELNSWDAADRAAFETYVAESGSEFWKQGQTDMLPQMNARAKATQLFDKHGADRMKELVESYTRYQNQKRSEEIKQAARTATSGDGTVQGKWVAGALHTAASVGANLVNAYTGPMGYIQEAVGRTGRYRTLDPNNAGGLFSQYAGAARSQVADNISGDKYDAQGNKVSDGGLLRQAGATVYEAGMSALDSFARIAAGGGNEILSLGLAATGSFSQTVSQASAQGATPLEAVVMGTIDGGLEILTEKVSLDNLFKVAAAGPKNFKQILKAILKSGAIEALEEELSLLGSTISEALILREKSSYERTIQQLVVQGQSYEAARNTADMQMIREAAMTALQSFMSGSMMGGGAQVVNAYKTRKTGRFLGSVGLGQAGIQDLIDSGLESAPDTESYQIAKELQEKAKAGKQPTEYELARLYQANQAAMAEELEAEQSEAPAENVTPEGDSVTEEGKNVITEGQNVTQQASNVAAAPLSIAEQIRRNKLNQGGTINGTEQTAAGTAPGIAGRGTGLLSGSSQWNDGAGTGEPAGSMGGSPETAAAAEGTQGEKHYTKTFDRVHRISGLRLQSISSRELGLQSGTDAKSIKVVPQEHWDGEMQQLAERLYQETKKQVSFVTGKIQIRGKDGKVRRVNGVIHGENITVRVDDLKLSMEQIADHEAYHGRVEIFGERLNEQIRQHITEKYSEEEFQEVVDRYMDALEGVYGTQEDIDEDAFADLQKKILEEVFADAYAGINTFGAGRFTSAVNEKMEQLGLGRYRNQDQENGVRETAGPPAEKSEQKENTAGNEGERYSIDTINGENDDYGIGVILDTNIFDGVRTRAWGTVLGNYVYDNLSGSRLMVYDEQGNEEVIYIARPNDRVQKDGAKNSHRVIDKLARYRGDNIKALATVHLSELLITSKYENTTSEHNHQWLDENGWEHRKTYIQDRTGNIYEATLNIANGRDRRILYDINNVRLIDKKRAARGAVPSTNGGRGSLTKSNSSEEMIAEQYEIVKENDEGILSDEEFQKRYGLRWAGSEDQEDNGRDERFSVDDEGQLTEEDFARVQAALKGQSRDWAENYLRNELGNEGYEQYRKWEKQQAEAKKQQTKERAKERSAEKQAARKQTTEPVAESKPIRAKRELRQQMMNLFSIPDGSRTELGAMIDSFADRLLKNGTVTEADRKHFFDRMYDAGVMTVPAEDYFSEGREILKGGRVYVPESVRLDFGDDWADIRRRAFGARIYFTSDANAGGIDMWNKELAAEIPGLFNAEETDMRSILERIVYVAEEGKDNQMSLAEFTAEMAGRGEISMDEFLDHMEKEMDWALRTFAEKAELEMDLRKRTGVQMAKERAVHKEAAQRQQDRKEMRQLQEKTLKALQWLNKNRNRAPEELREKFEEVLSDIDIYAIGAANEMNWSDKYNATWKDLVAMYDEAAQNDPNWFEIKEIDRIAKRLRNKKLEDMDVDTLNNLYRLATGLRTAFYNRKNVINDEMHRIFEEVYADSTREINDAVGDKHEGLLNDHMNLHQLHPMNFFQRMGGWNPDGVFYGIMKQLESGERDMRAHQVTAQKVLKDFMTEHEEWFKKADGQGENGVWYEIEIPELIALELGKTPKFGGVHKVAITPMQKVHMYLESKHQDNLRHMTGGRTFADQELYRKGEREQAFAKGRTIRMAPETVKAIVSDLTAEEMELAQLLDRYYNTIATNEINRVSNILLGYDKAVGKNYAPIYTDQNYTNQEFGLFDNSAEGVGNLKGRTYAKNPSYNISAIEAFERSVNQTARYVGMAIPVRNVSMLMNWKGQHSSMRSTITHKWGKEAIDYIETIVNDVQGKQKKGQEKGKLRVVFERAFGEAQNRYITTTFGFNGGIVLKQLGSIPLASAYLDAANVPKPAQIKSIDRELIGKYTQDLEWRTMGYSMPETKQLKDNPNWTQTNKFYSFTFGGGAITAMDGWAASVLWPWAENKVRRDFPELEVGTQTQIDNGESPFYRKVAILFNDALARSQSTTDQMYQSVIRKSDGVFAKMFSMFRSDSAQTYNTLRQKIGEAQYYARTGAKPTVQRAAKQAVGAAFVSMLLNAMWAEVVDLLRALWRNKGKNYRDDEGELTFGSIAEEMASGMVGSMAGVVSGGEETLEVIGNILTGKKIYDMEVMGVEQINDIISDTSDAFGGIRDVVMGSIEIAQEGGDQRVYWSQNWRSVLGSIKTAAKMIGTYGAQIPVNNIEAVLLGGIKWICPELGAAYDDLFQNISKNDLTGLSGDVLAGKMGRVLKDRGVTASDETLGVLAGLYEAGEKSAFPSDVPASVTIDEVKHTLSAYQQNFYGTVWNSVVSENLDALVADEEFRNADAESQAKMLSRLYKYATEMAKAELFEGYEISDSAQGISEMRKAGLDVYQAIQVEAKDADDFLEMVENGLTRDQAFNLTQEIAELEPPEGEDDVPDVQEWRLCIDFFGNEASQLAALYSRMSKEQYAKIELAHSFDVKPEAFVRYYEICSEYNADGKGSLTNKEAESAIDAISGLSTEQRAALWQIVTGRTSAKNNPYSKAVGQKVLDSKAEGQ